MALTGALVDRGRRLMDTPLPVKVEGATQFTTLTSQWFKCRLNLQAAPESDDPQGGRSRVPHPASLLCGRRDIDGNALQIASTDRIEVDSKALGRMVFQVTGDPEPLRRKRKVIGWLAQLTRVEEHEFQAAVP